MLVVLPVERGTGGADDLEDAYTLLDRGHLSDLSTSAYKYNSSLEMHLDSYAEP